MRSWVQLALFTQERAEKEIPTYCPRCHTHKAWFTVNHFMTTEGRWYMEYRCINCGRRDQFRTKGPEPINDEKEEGVQ